MAPAQFDQRSERYHHLRDLGFSAKDAKLWSHRSGDRQLDEIDRRIGTGTINEQIERETRDDRDRIILSKSDRIENWQNWSDKFGEGFPPNFAEEIADLNTANGRMAFDRFGYRAMWFWYVEGEDISDAEELAAGYEEDET